MEHDRRVTEHAFAPSGRSWHNPNRSRQFISAVEPPTLEQPTPKAEGVVRMGRPYGIDSSAREHEFKRLLAAGASFAEACEQSGMSRHRLVTLLDEQEFWTVAKALRDGRGGLVAVTVADTEAQAA